MPGLLQAPPERFGKTRYLIAAIAEFIGSGLFSFTGTAILAKATAGAEPDVVWAALGNGLALAVAIYCCANLSGGHITPSVTIATMITGHIPILKGLMYMLAQVTGSIFGILLIAGLVPDAYIGMGNHGVGCFTPQTGVTKGMLFGWEFFLDFILVSTVYAVAIGEPTFGNVAPFVVGLSLVVDLFAAAGFTGGGVSPARVLGPAIVFHCHWNTAWVYVLGNMLGGIIAGVVACPLYGDHAPWFDKLMPWGDHHMERESMMLEAAEKGRLGHPEGNLMGADHLTNVMKSDSTSPYDPASPTKAVPMAGV
ncbi:hypothetical protein WJX84_010082 [Apatococcus fuscideae]|uniref:Aquaporin n=1 Tax=Apatococcus fuscideae TaxID=2026836 RepID=A0AAW1SRY7_9CHLO